ncbi:unnamed protein product [Aureobasidium mustum]|uniref:Uncharacterized protein n=1 Tax=Aureobasidium mustum TaxID=2773714 RepID=A0A9N8PNI5_9PEZI|nr:unnamed protein product [Aureobasidium mustum]
MDTHLSRWLLWVFDRVTGTGLLDPFNNPDYFGETTGSAASRAALEKIHEIGDYADFPTEIRLMIFGYWLRDNHPPWDISEESRIPDWVTPDYEEVWFQNINFVLPAPEYRGTSFYDENMDIGLEANAINFLARLCARPKAPHPVTVEVAVDVHGDLRISQKSIHRLLLVSYHLGDRTDMLDVKVVVDTCSDRGYLEADSDIADPLLTRLQDDCMKMRKFRDGIMSMEQVFRSVNYTVNMKELPHYLPEVSVAGVLGNTTTKMELYAIPPHSSKKILKMRCRLFMQEVRRIEEEGARQAALESMTVE